MSSSKVSCSSWISISGLSGSRSVLWLSDSELSASRLVSNVTSNKLSAFSFREISSISSSFGISSGSTISSSRLTSSFLASPSAVISTKPPLLFKSSPSSFTSFSKRLLLGDISVHMATTISQFSLSSPNLSYKTLASCS